MEQFHDGHHVRLRSRVHGTFLHADEDGRGVSLHPRRASRNAAWAVHVFQSDGLYVLLHGAYGRYLSATATPAPTGHRGLRVAQSDFDQPEVEAILWQAVWSGSGNDVLLRHVAGRYLRANGRYLRWHTGVTVDAFDNLSTMMHWVVEAIPRRQTIPSLPGPPQQQSRGFTGLLRRIEPEPPSREIRYVQASHDGFFGEHAWATFQFAGRSVFNLRSELARRVGVVMFFFRLTMCVRAGRYGRLTPLVIDLPRSNEPMDIVLLTAGSRADDELRHPDVDAA